MKKVFIGLSLLFLIVVAGLSVAIVTIKPSDYREQLAELLSRKTGRTVRFDGSIRLGVSLDGPKIVIKNSVLGNPAWATRANMAVVSKFELGLKFLPLFSHKFVISGLKISAADIELEAAPDGSYNWDLINGTTPNSDAEKGSTPPSQDIGIDCDHLEITNSRLSFRDDHGTITQFNVSRLVLAKHGKGFDIDFRGMLHATPLAFKANIETPDFRTDHAWPITLDLVYAFYRLQTQVTVDWNAKTIDIPSSLLTAGASGLEGKLSVDWSGDRPFVKGTLASSHFALVDFLPTENILPTDTKSATDMIGPLYIFGDEALGLDRLRSVDASLDIALNDVVLHTASLQKLKGHLALQKGLLDAPLKAGFGKGGLSVEFKLNAAVSPAQLVIVAGSSNIDLSDLLALADSPAVLTGKAEAKAAISASGGSLHEWASTMSGTIDVVADSGEISGSAAGDISSSLMDFIAPHGSSALNCLAIRLIANNGIVHDNGILVDTAVSTIAGKGGIDMSTETIDIALRAQTKLTGFKGILPPLYVGGTLLKPNFSVSPQAVVEKIVGALAGEAPENGVPEVVSQPGQNACLYTLNHPIMEQENGVLMPGFAGGIQRLESMGKQMLNHLFGQ